MPGMIYGSAWKHDRTAELVKLALEVGFAGLDTANQPAHYREDLVGLGLEQFLAGQSQRSRADIFLQTKYSPGQDTSQYGAALRPYDAGAPVPQQVAQSMRTSLQHLRTDYVDSFVLHSPLQSMEMTMQAWRAMEQLVTEGRAKSLGISNIYSLPQLQAIYAQARVKPAVVQNHFAADKCFDVDLRRWCGENGVKYQSFWTLTANGPGMASPPVQELVVSRGLTKQQVWFLFVMADGIVPLTGTTSLQHMKQDLSLLQEAPLLEADRSSIWRYVQGHTGCAVLPLE